MPEFDSKTWQELRRRLASSAFRRKFRLSPSESDYFQRRGAAAIREHANAFIQKRLAPAQPAKDGRQTPWRGHPVFVAQHATATCCRTCLAKWHGIPAGRALREDEVAYIVSVIMAWLRSQFGAED